MVLFFKQWLGHPRSPSGPPVRPPAAPRPRPAYLPPAYVLVVDESGSTASSFRMAARRVTSRIAGIQMAAQRYLRQLLASNPRQLVSLVGFSDTATLYHPLAPVGPAIRALSQAVRSLHPQCSTNLSAGLALGLAQLNGARGSRGNLVVITDGAANAGTSELPGLIRRARTSGVRIFTIGVGNNDDADYDRDLLVRMARATAGRFSSAHSFEALCNALRRVA